MPSIESDPDFALGGPAQRRLITTLTAAELRSTNPRTPQGVTRMTVWTRAGRR